MGELADEAGLAALLASLDGEVERAEGRRTAEEEAAGMEQVREEAVLYGDNPKSSGWHGWAGSMARRFQRSTLNAAIAELLPTVYSRTPWHSLR